MEAVGLFWRLFVVERREKVNESSGTVTGRWRNTVKKLRRVCKHFMIEAVLFSFHPPSKQF